MKLKIFLGMVCWFTTILAQIPYLGVCPELKPMENFDVERYMGCWYEAERYFSLLELGGKCVYSNYTDGVDNSINIISKQLSTLTGSKSTVNGEASKVGKEGDAKLNIKYSYLPVDMPYWVLDTDYSTYSVVWSCTNFGIFSARNAWILTRERNPSLQVMEKAYGIIDRNFISRAYFIRTDQKSCPEEF